MVINCFQPPWGAKNWTLVLYKRPPFLKNSFNKVLSKKSVVPELAILIVLSRVWILKAAWILPSPDYRALQSRGLSLHLGSRSQSTEYLHIFVHLVSIWLSQKETSRVMVLHITLCYRKQVKTIILVPEGPKILWSITYWTFISHKIFLLAK